MIMDEEPISLASQHLTPKKVMWILDIGETTLRAWTRQRRISSEKFGRQKGRQIVRYDPAAVFEFIKRNRRVAKTGPFGNGAAAQPLAAEDWQKIERLIQEKLKAES